MVLGGLGAAAEAVEGRLLEVAEVEAVRVED